MTDTIDTEAAASAHPAPGTAGAKLRAAREAAGLTVDAVAQQLKLAPRQVVALEEDDFQQLPGRTFVRGFARNYARFLQLDADALLALLPATEGPSTLERPSFTAARRPMGEIPVDRATSRSPARILLPLLLVAIVAAAGYYEYRRLHEGESREATLPARSETVAAAPQAAGTATPPASAAPAPAAAPATAGTTTTSLPNPVAAAAAPGAELRDGAIAQPATTGAASVAPPVAGQADAAAPASAATAQTPATREGAASPAAEAALVLAFKGTSWAEVRDAKGRVILQMTGGAGMTQTVSGIPPLELALGNAPEVAVTYRGQSLDLGPYTRGNVARVALK